MPLLLKNLTGSVCNVPFNPDQAEPKYIVRPGDSVLVPDEYLAALTEETVARLKIITEGDSPMFEATVQEASKKKAK
jgi:hypothetical protein